MEVKCVVPGEKGNTIRGEKKNDPYTVLTTQRSSQPQNCLHSSTDRTSGYGLEDRGSNPLGDTKKSLIEISKVCNDINIVG